MAAPTPTTVRKTIEVPIEALPRIYWAVVSTSKSTEAEWREVCGERLEGECLLCGMHVSGMELRQLATSDAEQPVEDPKLERLRLKYCARNGCESRFYRIHIQPDSELHWTGIKGQLLHTTPEARESRPRRRLPSFNFTRHRLLLFALGGLSVLLLFFLLRYWVYGYRIPVIQKKHEYRVNPASG